jgi:hypothetical protein
MPTLDWLTRREDEQTAGKAPYRLLEPVPELSAGDPAAENMLIHGDNLEGLPASVPISRLVRSLVTVALLWLAVVMTAGCIGSQSWPNASSTPEAPATTAPVRTPTATSTRAPAPTSEPASGIIQLSLRPVLLPGQALLEADRDVIRRLLFRRATCLASDFDAEWQSDERIIVRLAGVRTPDAVVKTLTSPGRLEFAAAESVDLNLWPLEEGSYVRTSANRNGPDRTIQGAVKDPFPNQVFHTILDAQHLKEAHPQLDENFNVSIAMEFTDEGKRLLADYTARHIGEVLAVVLDNIVLMAPVISGAIPDGHVLINSTPEEPWTVEEAGCLTAMMAGMLPFPLEVVEQSGASAMVGTR